MFERLTIKTDICIEPENEIVYHNPNDPEGMYNILDLAECLYSGGEAEVGILMEISRRLAAYEDTGLTPERIRELQNAFNILFESERQKQQENEQLKEQINTAKIGWDTYKTYSEQLEQQTAESNKIIETQRQEIEKLKATLADWKYNAKCDADHIAALTTDKDELVKVLKQAREVLENTRF